VVRTDSFFAVGAERDDVVCVGAGVEAAGVVVGVAVGGAAVGQAALNFSE